MPPPSTMSMSLKSHSRLRASGSAAPMSDRKTTTSKSLFSQRSASLRIKWKSSSKLMIVRL
ncbi:MAG: hypothetical protein ABIJ56_03540 [Pseudomonadota bacterium]